MADDRLTGSLQENLLAILAYDKSSGGIVANMLDTNVMEGEYRLLAERIIDYRRKFNEPPKEHTADLVDDIVGDKDNKRARGMKRTLDGIYQIAPTINTDYVLDKLMKFDRLQRVKAAILESAEKINNNAEMALGDVEDIWQGILQTEQVNFKPGLKLGAYKQTLQRVQSIQNEFTTGIPELDRNGVVPMRGTVFMLLAAAGRGKTWAAIHIAKQALRERKKVLHVTLEMDEELVMMRYYQSLFTVPKRKGLIYNTTMHIELGELRELDRVPFRPQFYMGVSNIDLEMDVHLEKMGTRTDNLVVKRFKGRTLTPHMLASYMDNLEATEGFIPDMVVIDYPRLMKVDTRDLRLSMDNLLVDLRALADDRNLAMICPHQSNKEGEEAATIKGTNLSEAWALAGTVDVLVTYSCTDIEFAFGLGRLFVAKCRTEKDRYTTLITQNYGTGQFVLDSHRMQPEYADLLKSFTKAHRDTADENDEDD